MSRALLTNMAIILFHLIWRLWARCLLAAAALLSSASVFAAAASLQPYSISANDVEKFVTECKAETSIEEMRAAIPSMLAHLKPKMDVIENLTSSTELLGRVVDLFSSDKGQQRFNVVLDGFPLLGVDRANLFAVAELTALDGAAGARRHVSKLDFQGREWVATQRFCLSEDCKRRKVVNGHNLREFGHPPICQDALCASQRLFGDEQGLRILWIYLKYGAAIGEFTDSLADTKGFSLDSIRALSIAFDLLPEFHRPVALMGSHFYHYIRGDTLPMYRNRRIHANAAGAVFDPMDEKSLFAQAAMMFHEVAHRTTLVDSLDESSAWLVASGWRMDRNASAPAELGVWPSYYAKSNPLEDYAETFVMYRLRPKALLGVSPRRYEFMRERGFRGLEYTRDRCGGS